MEALILLVVAAVLAGRVLLRLERRREPPRLDELGPREFWKQSALACGLTDIKALRRRSTGDPAVSARLGALRIRLCECNDGAWRRRTRIVIQSERPGLDRLTLHPGSANHQEETAAVPKVEVGDGEFDEAFFVSGSVTEARALLDAATREHLVQLRTVADLALREGRLRIDLRDDRDLAAALGHALAIARRLDTQGRIAERLAQSTWRDPVPSIRQDNLRLLARAFPTHAVVAAALRRACADPDPEVRLAAAPLVGEDGVAVLLAVAEASDTADEQAARVVDALGDRLPRDRAEKLLGHSLDTARPATARACLRRLDRGERSMLSALLEAILDKDPAALADVADRIQAPDIAAAEGTLIEALWEEDDGLRTLAADLLARAGTVAAVNPLQRAAERSFDREFRLAARQAIHEIQSRLGRASPGQLSFPIGPDGGVSMVDDKRGRLRFADADDESDP
jgi:hypothetical protein